MARYSLKEVFGSPEKKLAKFKSRKVTKTKFYCHMNSLVVLKDEETVIGVVVGSFVDVLVLRSKYSIITTF